MTTVSQWEQLLTGLVETFVDDVRGSVFSSFGELLLQDKVVSGGVTNFYEFLSNEVATVSQFNQVKAVRLFATHALTAPFTNHTCDTPSVAAQIVARLAEVRSYDNVYLPTNFTCHGNRWAIHNCPTYATVKMCVNCFDPCILSDVNSDAVFPFQCETSGGCLQALQVYSIEPFPPASISDVVVQDLSKTTFQLSIAASDACFIYCKAYPHNVVPRTVEEVIVQNNVNYTINNHVNLAFTGLSPASNYSVYCVTKSLSGSTSTFASMIANAVPVVTKCCKSVTVSLIETSYSAGFRSASAVRVVFNDAPLTSVSLSLTHAVAAGVNTSVSQTPYLCFFSPSVSLRDVSAIGTGAAHTLSVQCGAKIASGSYSVTASLTGPSAAEYSVSFPNGNIFKVINAATVITVAPAFSTAVFSNDGGYVTVSFTSSTNKALLPDAFTCSLMLTFVGNADAHCVWTDARTIRIALYGATKLTVGDVIRLAAAPSSVSNLKVLCPTNIVCGPAPSINPAGTMVVQAPALPTWPLVLVAGPASIGQCQALTLDFSSCSGSAGREWSSVKVMVTSTKSDNTSAVEQQVSTLVRTASRISLPGFSLKGDRVYTMFFTLCNFLGSCGSGRFAVRVTNSSAPLVHIFGPLVSSLKPSDAVVLSASVANANCAGTADTTSTSSLKLEWAVLQNNVQVTRLVSSSVDPLKFYLGAYLLTVGQQYKIRLTATDRRTLLSSQASVTVLITPTSLVSIISGGTSRSISSMLPFTLDASKSYDSNLSPTARFNDILREFQWSCQVVGALNITTPCPLRFDRSVRGSPSITVTPIGYLSVNASFVMTLSLTKDTRLSQSSILLIPQAHESCFVNLASSYFGVVNVNQKVQLGATVRSNAASTLVWKFNDNSQLNISAIALSAVRSTIVPAVVGTTSMFAANLAIRPNVLVAGASYTLTLSCLQSIGGRQVTVSTSSIDLTMNAPPSAGSLTVTPSHGVALTDLFTFVARNWVDTELPLTYKFGFISPSSGATLQIRGQSVLTYGSSLLPAGSTVSGGNITIVLSVFDSMSANTSTSQRVRVTDSASSVYAFAAPLAAVRNDSEQTRQLISIYSTAINAVNCTLAPDCAALNRESCVAVDHTCGVCLDTYFGDTGNSNAPCFAQSRRLQATTCASTAACSFFESCLGGYCIAQNKTCVQDCFGHGQCEFSSHNTGLKVPSCAVTDFSCSATCVCDASHFGTACVRTALAQYNRATARHDLITAFSDLLVIDYPEADTVTSWITILSSLVQVPDELSNAAGNDVVTLIQSVIAAAQTQNLPFETAMGLTLSISSIPTSLTPPSASSPAVTKVYYENVMRVLLQQYCELVANDLNVQQQIVSIEPTFRVVTSSFYVRDGASISAPLLPIEEADSAWVPQAYSFGPSTDVAGLSDSVSLSLVVLRARDFAGSNFNSNPVRLFFHSSTSSRFFSAANTDRISVTLQNIKELDVVRRPTTNYTTECFNRRPVNHSYACPGGFPDIVVSCRGTAGTIFSRCPYYYHDSVCSTTSRTLTESPRCERVSFDATSTVCACTWPVVFASNRRYLLDTLSSSDVALTTTDAFRYFTFEGVFTSAAEPATAEKVLTAPATMAVVGGMFFLLIFLVLWTDNRQWDVSTWSLLQAKKEKENEEHDDLESSHYPGSHTTKNSDSGYRSAMLFSMGKSLSSRNWTVDEELGANGAAPPLKYVLKNALPAVFQVQNFFVSLYRELKNHHRVFSVLVSYCTYYTRLARLASIVTHINLFLLSNYLIVVLAYSADKECYKHSFENDCLSKISLFDSFESKCEWDSFYNTCNNHVPKTSAFSVIVAACLAQLLCVPFHLAIEYVIRKVADCRILAPEPAALSTKSLNMARAVLQPSARGGFNFGGNKIAPVPRVVRFNTTAQDLVELENAVLEALQAMDPASQDVLLGNIDRYLSKLNGFKIWHEPTSLQASATITPEDATTPRTSHIFRTERFHRVASQLTALLKQEYLHVEHLEEKEKSAHMLLLFALDLLPTVTARIVADKAERDRPRPWSLTFWQAVATWVLIAAVNILVFVMCVLLTLELNNDKQTLWINSFILWLCLEPFMVNVMYVLIAHMFLPSLVVKGLQVAKIEINRIVDKYILDNRKRESKLHPRSHAAAVVSTGYNFAPNFFLSSKVAKLFPTFRESRLIQSYRTDQSYYGALMTTPLEDTPHGDSQVYSWLLRWFSNRSILTQDIMIYFFATVCAGLLCLLHVELYRTIPGLLAVPSGLALILLVVLLMRNYKKKIMDVGNSADLTLTVHDNHIHVIDLVDTSKADIMQSKFFKQDGVHDMLTPAAVDRDEHMHHQGEQKMSEMQDEHTLHIIDNENELEYDPSRRRENIMEFRRQQKERDDEELRRLAEENPRSEAGMEMQFQANTSQRTPLPTTAKPDLAKVAAQASITTQVQDKLSKIAMRIKSAKLTPVAEPTPVEAESPHSHKEEEEKFSWLPSQLNLAEEMNESDKSDDDKYGEDLRTAELARRTPEITARMNNLRIAQNDRRAGTNPLRRPTPAGAELPALEQSSMKVVSSAPLVIPTNNLASVSMSPIAAAVPKKSNVGAMQMKVQTTPARPVINRFKSKVIAVTPKNSEKYPSFTPQPLKMSQLNSALRSTTNHGRTPGSGAAPSRRVSRVPGHDSSSSSGSSSSASASSSSSDTKPSNGDSSSSSSSGSSGSDSSTSSSGSSSDSDSN